MRDEDIVGWWRGSGAEEQMKSATLFVVAMTTPPEQKQTRNPFSHKHLSSVPELASSWSRTVRERRCVHCQNFLFEDQEFCGNCHGVMPDRIEPVDITFLHIKEPEALPVKVEQRTEIPVSLDSSPDPNAAVRKAAKERHQRAFREDCYDSTTNAFWYFHEGTVFVRKRWEDRWVTLSGLRNEDFGRLFHGPRPLLPQWLAPLLCGIHPDNS